MSVLISVKLTEDWPLITRWNFTGCLALQKRTQFFFFFLRERHTVVLSQISINRPRTQSWINGVLQNLFIFLLVNKPVLIVVGILKRVKTALLERSVTHFVKGEILIGVCSDLLFIYCADRLVTSSLNAVFLLVFWFMKMWVQPLRRHQGSRLWLSLITVSIDLMHFRIMQHARGALGRAALMYEYPQ